MFTRFLAALALLFASSPAQAWWEYGHYTVADVAMLQVKPATRAKIRQLLRYGPALETPECPTTTLALAAYWPDCIKQYRDRFSYANSWHYQNADICKPFDLKEACNDGNCVSAQITRNAKLLSDPKLPKRERLMALSFLAHFVGDLHMPLHAGDKSDRGGNDLKATYGMFQGPRTNLHSVWDGFLAERAISTPPAGPRGLLQAAKPGMADGSVTDWSRESWAVSRDVAYTVAMGDPCGPVPARAALDNAKIEALVPTVRDQVLRGGLRLARLLDEALR
jgi:S1/P1 Nuclease